MCSTMTDKPDACAHPFGEKMVLTVTGTKYQYTNPIVSAGYAKPTIDTGCERPSRTTRGDNVTRAASFKHGLPIGYEFGPDEREQRSLLRVNSAIVYHATMTVNSRMRGNKYHDGIFQFVTAIDDLTTKPVSQAEARDAYVLKPYKLELSFFKTGDSY